MRSTRFVVAVAVAVSTLVPATDAVAQDAGAGTPVVERLAIIEYVRGSRTSYALFAPGAKADMAVLCVGEGTKPRRPADAVRCGRPDVYQSGVDSTGVAKPVHVVFAFNSATGAYGPPVVDGDVPQPALIPSDVGHQLVSSTSIDITIWLYTSPIDGGANIGLAGTVAWEIAWNAGTVAPAENHADHLVRTAGVPVKDIESRTVYRIRGLRPESPITYAVRGVDSSGNRTPYSRHTAIVAPSVAGAYLIELPRGAAPRTTTVPGTVTRTSEGTSALAVEGNGAVHVLSRAIGTHPDEYAVRPPRQTWRRAALPPRRGVRSRPNLITDSRAANSRRALMIDDCVHVRSSSTGWRQVGCAKTPRHPSELGPPIDQVFGLEVDSRGAVHVAFSGRHFDGVTSINYATNASGAWRISRVLVLTPDEGHIAGALTRDPVSDALVFALGTSKSFRVGRKTPAAARFTLSARPVRSTAYLPRSVASYGGRITVSARQIRPADGPESSGPPVLLSGASPATVGSAVPVPRARPVDHPPLVYAHSSTRVLLAWTWNSFNARSQGTWTAWRTYVPGVGSSISIPVRVTASAYDRLGGVSVDRGGRAYILVNRQAPTPPEQIAQWWNAP